MLGAVINRALKPLGYRCAPIRTSGWTIPVDPSFADLHAQIPRLRTVFDPTLATTYAAVQSLVRRRIPGDFVECGVSWGKQALMMAHTLAWSGDLDRPIVLYDTFTGMPQPDPMDGPIAAQKWRPAWHAHALSEVQALMADAPYPASRIRYVPGDVCETVKAENHAQIALLRIDVDWYRSTKHVLETLRERVVPGGIVILDDYGRWPGAKRAIDDVLGKEAPWLIRTGPSEHVYVQPGRLTAEAQAAQYREWAESR